jgi:hypothetical protein
MPKPRSARVREPDSFELHFEADAASDALPRVLAFALTLSLTPRRVRAERNGDWLEAALAFDRAGERPAQLLLGKTEAIVSVRRARLAGYPDA